MSNDLTQTSQPVRVITDEQRAAAEAEIREQRQLFDYNTKEYPIQNFIQTYVSDSELFLPKISWNNIKQSKFIESIFMGLPTLPIFVAKVFNKDKSWEHWEIVDGKQRVLTVVDFLSDRLLLEGLTKLRELNDLTYTQLPLTRQRKFNRSTLRVIELSDKADEEVRREVAERINAF